MLTRLRNVPTGKTQCMKKLLRRAAAVAAIGFAPLAFVTIASPAVSHADCAWGEWWDPVASVCRPTGLVLPKDCTPGWWDPTINDCRPPLVPPPPP
jgi:hypothetical protein